MREPTMDTLKVNMASWSKQAAKTVSGDGSTTASAITLDRFAKAKYLQTQGCKEFKPETAFEDPNMRQQLMTWAARKSLRIHTPREAAHLELPQEGQTQVCTEIQICIELTVCVCESGCLNQL